MTLAKSEPNRVDKTDNKLPKLTTTQKPPVSEEEMRQAVRTLLLGLGEDPDREGLRDTPKRVVKALKFLTSGYHQSLDELLNGAVFHENTDEMVLVRDITYLALANTISYLFSVALTLLIFLTVR